MLNFSNPSLRAMLAGLSAIFAVAIAFHFYSPQAVSPREVVHLKNGVEVRYDAAGVAHVFGKNREDAGFAIGYVHASRRPLQMLFAKHAPAGRLSEIAGPVSLPQDKLMRQLQLYRAANAQLAQLAVEDRLVLEAYARGVNAGFADGGLGLLQKLSSPVVDSLDWGAVDSVAWSMYTAFLLAGNWRTEMDRLLLSRRLSSAEVSLLLPNSGQETTTAFAEDESANLYKPLDAPDAFDQKETRGSNVWAVVGNRSRSGYPLLANDPHLPLTVPSPWLLARISIDGDDPQQNQDVIGATSPGLPMVLLGRTPDVAWGLTRSPANSQGLFLEDPQPQDDLQSPANGSPSQLNRHTEVIRVRGAADEQVTVEEGANGPIVSELLPEHAESGELLRRPIALSWRAFHNFSGSITAAFASNRARTCAELLDAFKVHTAPTQNLVGADTQGHVCMKLVGELEDTGKGPTNSNNSTSSRNATIPDIAKAGMSVVANANQAWSVPGAAMPSGEWDRPYRYGRILDLLNRQPQHDMRSFANAQYDTVSNEALKLLPVLTKAQPHDNLSLDALRVLQEFDGNMRADSPAPLVYTAWLDELTRTVIGERVGLTLFSELYGRRLFRHAIEAILLNEKTAASWCRSPMCQQELSQSLARAVERVAEQHGATPRLWRWGKAHRVRAYIPAEPEKRFESGNGPEVGGDISTVQMTHFDTDKIGSYPTSLAANVRLIYDLADRNSSWFVHFGGLDEGASARNAKAVEEWRLGQYRELRFEPRGWAERLLFVPKQCHDACP